MKPNKLLILEVIFISGSFAISGLSGSVLARSFTLKEIYQHSLQNRESIQIQQIEVEQSGEKLQQNQSAFYPKLKVDGGVVKQDTQIKKDQNTTTLRLHATQPIFRGGGEYAGLRQGQQLYLQQKYLLEEEKVVLMLQIIPAYFNGLLHQREIQNLKNIRQMSVNRISTLQARVQIGKSRSTDLILAQSQLSNMDGQIIKAQGDWRVSLHQLQFYSNLDLLNSEISLTHVFPDKVILKDIHQYLSLIMNRPKVTAGHVGFKALSESVQVAKAGHFPQLDLQGNSYLQGANHDKGINWDLGLFVTLPLYQGGEVQSKVQEAVLEKSQQVLRNQQFEKELEHTIRSLYAQIGYTQDQLEYQKKAVEQYRKNYHQQVNDFGLGLVSNLDVHQAMNFYLDAERLHDRTFYELWKIYYTLQAHLSLLDLG